MRLGKTVQQQQRRPLAADAGENAPGFGIDPFGGVTGKQVGEIGHGFGTPALQNSMSSDGRKDDDGSRFKLCLSLPLARLAYMPSR
jgi:hypothetical protein